MSLVTPLKRTAIIVTDMKKSLRFYRDVLGLNVWVQGKMGKEVPAIFRLLGAPPGTVRWVILQSEDVDWGMVGLFELRRPSPPRVRPRTLAQANAGEACLVFHTPDVDAASRREEAETANSLSANLARNCRAPGAFEGDDTARPERSTRQFHPERPRGDDDAVEPISGIAISVERAQSRAQEAP